MMGGVALLGLLPEWAAPGELFFSRPVQWRLLIFLLGLVIATRCLIAVIDPTPRAVQRAVRQGILSLVFLDAAAVFAYDGLYWAMLILLLLVPINVLGRWIYST
jgi:4-hydroxybenzoate polyprenyltransferase